MAGGMVGGHEPLMPQAPFRHPAWLIGPGLAAAGILLVMTVAGLAALFWQAPLPALAELWQQPYLRRVLTFTLWQATLSTLLSLAVGLAVAMALARRAVFPGRGLLLRLMELSLVLPTIVAVSGLIGVFGRQGWLTRLADGWLPGWNLYGLGGILLAHVFFNAPLAGRLLLQALESVPAPRRRIASQLGLRGRWLWLALDWPAIRRVLPGITALVFTLCFTSFAIIMTLGGGPASTTLEVAIYQSLRFEFDFGRAALLAVVQLALCGLLWLLLVRRAPTRGLAPDRRLPEPIRRPDQGGLRALRDRALLLAFSLFLVMPLAAVLIRGLPGADRHVPAGWRPAGHALARHPAQFRHCASGRADVRPGRPVPVGPWQPRRPLSGPPVTADHRHSTDGSPDCPGHRPVPAAQAQSWRRRTGHGSGGPDQRPDGPALCRTAAARALEQSGRGQPATGQSAWTAGLVPLALAVLAKN